MVLTREQARKFYDRFGKKQDSQAIYEDAALADLVAHAAFDQAHSVFELGCGTGRFAFGLLAEQLPAAATYRGIDLSRTMVGLASQRLTPYAERATVTQTDGDMHFPLPPAAVDRVVSTYVLDLLSETDIRLAIAEARRVLAPGGKLCLVSLTQGQGLGERLVTGLWSALFRLHGGLVGGCRPIRLEPFLERRLWVVEYRNLVSRFGVPSEVLIARPTEAPARPGD